MCYRIVRLLALFLTSLFLTGCATTKLTRLDDLSPTEGIAVVKFHILYNDKDVTKGCGVVFDPLPSFGTPKNQFGLDDSGYVMTKLPVGQNSIRLIVHRSGLMQHRFAAGELSCQISGGGTINYLGDVTFNWNGMGTGSGFALAAVSPILNSLGTGGAVKVSVESNPAAAQAAFRQKFPNDLSLIPALLVGKPRP